MKKKLPKLKTDKAAEDFVAKADLTQYDLSEMRTVQFAVAATRRSQSKRRKSG